ncbi:MAG: hypothetical protein D6751_10795 [Deltaproteobacteria bacterium]|nr:MAG: hypothetical protein D6751_10795 [Deltaproteobacteria bacterium]
MSKKRKRGRPPLFATPEDMQQAVDVFFATCEANEWPATIAGLANALGMDRMSLLNYSRKDDFFDVVKRARQKVEEEVERRMLSGQAAAGAIFWMKNNAAYRDKMETEHSGAMQIERIERVIVDGDASD